MTRVSRSIAVQVSVTRALARIARAGVRPTGPRLGIGNRQSNAGVATAALQDIAARRAFGQLGLAAMRLGIAPQIEVALQDVGACGAEVARRTCLAVAPQAGLARREVG